MNPANPHPLVKSSIVFLDPQLARQLYAGNTENQRRVSKANLAKVEQSIRTGLFVLNGESIIQSISGKLLNGQHRVLGVINTGIGIWTVLVLNVPDEYFHTIDCGKARSFADVCQISGDPESITLSSCIQRLAEYFTDESTVGVAQPIPHARLFQVREMCPGLIDSVRAVGPAQKVIAKSRTAWLHYAAHAKFPAEANRFFESLGSGVGLRSDSAVWMLRERMLKDRASKAKLSTREAIALLIKAWNAYLDDVPLKVLRWSDGEPFPRVKLAKARAA